MLEKLKEMRRAGINVLSLLAEGPNFDTPDHIKEAAKTALDNGFTSLTEPAGLPELRETIANKLQVDNGIDADPRSEILVTSGAKQAIFEAILSTIEIGDEVIIADPCWVSYEPCIRIAGGIPIPVALRETCDFSMNIQEIERCITPRVKMIVVNSPHNPTGLVLTKDEIESIAEIAMRNNMLILSDESYEKLVYDGNKHYSFASLPKMKERTISVFSFSKSHLMAGWRLGYACANSDIIRRMSLIHQHSASCAVSFGQKAAIKALKGPIVPLEKLLSELRRNRRYIVHEMNAIPGVQCITPKGTWHSFPKFEIGGFSSKEFAEFLLEKEKVATVPGSVFGEHGENHLRLTFTNSLENIKEAVERIKIALEGLRSKSTLG